MNRERWVRDLADAARGYNEPPETPRDRMWNRIDAARAEARHDDVVIEPTQSWWIRRRIVWPAAVVAALVIGLTIGRVTSRPGGGLVGESAVTVATDATVPADSGTPSAAYRLAAVPVLERTEALLLQVRTGTGRNPAGSSEPYTSRATSLLAQTRLLLASPAADDPELAPLLRDLELALVRIVRLAAGTAASDIAPDQKAFEDGLERKSVLPRLRDLLAADIVVVES